MACRLLSSTALRTARISLSTKTQLPSVTAAVSFLCHKPAIRLNVQSTALFNTSTRLFNSSFNTAVETENSAVISEEPKKPRFDSIPQMHPKTALAIKQVFGYETMSEVQDAVLSGMPRSDDMFVKAKTGTGKTLAFLIPAIETLIAKRKERRDNNGSIIIISPTRELAMQIEAEAKKLCKFHKLKTHLLVGGNGKYQQIAQLNRFPADIIVGTPGRLQDMQNTVRHVTDACKNADVLILDEADVLLEMGFRDATEEFLKGVRTQRQTLLFSATVSPSIRSIANIALREDFTYLDLVGEAQANVHLHVPQRFAIHNTAKQPELAHRIISAAAKSDQHSKVIVFLPTTKMTVVYADYLRGAGVRNLCEIHSGLAQMKRTRVSDKFRQMKSGVLVTSDVSARGVDYPNVSLVLQIGIPDNREQYIHRIGRTGRAGKSGQSMIVLSPWERGFLDHLKDIPITECDEWSASAMTRKHQAGELEDPIGDVERKRASESLDVNEVHPAVLSLLGFYASKQALAGFRKEDLPENLSDICKAFGMPPPTFSPSFLAKVLGGGSQRGKKFGGRGGFSGGRGGFGGREGGFGGRERREGGSQYGGRSSGRY